MENSYKAYTKLIDGKTFYFVKKFLSFPELTGTLPILESFGMHTDFERACSIASLHDAKIKEQLLEELKGNATQAKIIDLNDRLFSETRFASM